MFDNGKLCKINLDYDKLYEDSDVKEKDKLREKMKELEKLQNGHLYAYKISDNAYRLVNALNAIDAKYVLQSEKVGIDCDMKTIAKMIVGEINKLENEKKIAFYKEFEENLKKEYEEFIENRGLKNG